jgi:AraC-like DNA-binding protein
MESPRLDRLSALLEGLCPKVTLAANPTGLSMHILQTVKSTQTTADSAKFNIEDLAMLICPSGYLVEQNMAATQQCFMSFEVEFEGPMRQSFLSELSRPITIGMKDADPSLTQVIALLANEMQASRCGQPLFMNRAGEILLISLMRHLTSRPQLGKGLFNALSDPRIAKSLVAMHTQPGHSWTLDGLAQLAGMSRTSFANNFKDAMQVSPGKYLENLRLAIARQMTQSGIGLKQVATKTGYASPSTLSRALNRLN